jgi:catechol 2,3-dioxygenase-like lactoylglutathione lyase family enzyme
VANSPLQRSICHASIGTNNLAAAAAFYVPLLKTVEIELVCQYAHAMAFGKGYPEFWLQLPFDQQPASVGNGTHFGFVAASKAQVVLFYQTAIALGARCDGKPGARLEYGEPYYGCFVRDLDGHKIEASFWDMAMAEKIYGSHL